MALKRGYKALLDEANALVEAVTPHEAAAWIGDQGYQFVDLRDIRELKRTGRIAGAFHCPRGMLEFWIDPESPYHKEVFAAEKTFVFYCASGWRSALAARTAMEMGLAPVVHVKGGLTAWVEAGLNVEAPAARS